MKVKESILILGANGQIGSELTVTLRAIYGSDQVIATDIKPALHQLDEKGPYYQIDVLDTMAIAKIIKTHQVKQVYLLAAMLSATAEQKIKSAWKLNMDGLI
jgi:dTDP-4-dehydrorhamnose reductase